MCQGSCWAPSGCLQAMKGADGLGLAVPPGQAAAGLAAGVAIAGGAPKEENKALRVTQGVEVEEPGVLWLIWRAWPTGTPWREGR